MSAFELSPAIPQLPSHDIDETAKFFEKFLGFEVVAKMKEHNFLIMKRGPAEIHFWQAENRESAETIARESSCYIRVKNIPALFEEFKMSETPFRYELKQMPWGMLEMQIDDPTGNAIKFGEPI